MSSISPFFSFVYVMWFHISLSEFPIFVQMQIWSYFGKVSEARFIIDGKG